VAESASGNGDSRRSLRRKRSRRANPDGTMTLIEHIYEFRRRLGFALLAVVIGGIFGFIWFFVFRQLRVAQQNASALELARFLEDHPKVARVQRIRCATRRRTIPHGRALESCGRRWRAGVGRCGSDLPVDDI